MRLWPSRRPKRRCPFVCEHVGTDRVNVGSEERPRMAARCGSCGTTWPTWQHYLAGTPGVLPTEALPR